MDVYTRLRKEVNSPGFVCWLKNSIFTVLCLQRNVLWQQSILQTFHPFTMRAARFDVDWIASDTVKWRKAGQPRVSQTLYILFIVRCAHVRMCVYCVCIDLFICFFFFKEMQGPDDPVRNASMKQWSLDHSSLFVEQIVVQQKRLLQQLGLLIEAASNYPSC